MIEPFCDLVRASAVFGILGNFDTLLSKPEPVDPFSSFEDEEVRGGDITRCLV